MPTSADQDFAREMRLAHGCTLCDCDLVVDGREAAGVAWVPLDRILPGKIETIEVPICASCRPSLATTDGITALAVAVNARER